MQEVEFGHPLQKVAKAFWVQYNVILLVGVVLFSLALGSVVPLLFGLAAELVWLVIGPRLLEQRETAKPATVAERAHTVGVSGALARLEAPYQARFAALGGALEEIRVLYTEQPDASRPELEAAMGKLEQLRGAFLKYAAIHQRVLRFINETPSGELEREVTRLGQQLAAEKDVAVRVTVRHALSLAERRLQQRETIANTRRAVEVRMETLEKSFAYIKSRILGFGSGSELLAEIEALVNQVGSVGALEAEIHDAMRSSVVSQQTLRPASGSTDPQPFLPKRP